jgi:hypothetical protein
LLKLLRFLRLLIVESLMKVSCFHFEKFTNVSLLLLNNNPSIASNFNIIDRRMYKEKNLLSEHYHHLCILTSSY